MSDDTQKTSAVDDKRYQQFGKLLKDLRSQSKLSQPDLAKRLKTTQQTVSRWEAGISRPRSDQLIRLAEAFEMDADDLLIAAGYQLGKTVAATVAQPFPVEALSWENFERFCAYFLERRYPNAKVHHAGTRGHGQDGIDISVDFPDGQTFSFQCKRVNQFGPADVVNTINSYRGNAANKYILLTRIASPNARRAVSEHGVNWDIWDKEDVSRIIRQHLSKDEQRQLVDTFFRGQRLALLGEDEPGPWQNTNEFFAPFVEQKGPFNHTWDLVGRAEIVSKITDYLSESDFRVKLLVGAGGSGKTRVLKEALDNYEKQHKTALIHIAAPNAEITLRSLKDLGNNRKIFIVDDAHERSDLEPLFQYVAIPEHKATVLLVSRPYGVRLIKGKASTFGLSNFVEIGIEPFSFEEATKLAAQVLNHFGGHIQMAEQIARVTQDCPLATVLSAYLMAQDKVHPELFKNEDQFRNTIFGKFEKVIAGNIGTEAEAQLVRRLLKILALIQPFDPDDNAVARLAEIVESVPSTETNKIIPLLSTSGILFKRGGRYQLSPDMLADFIIERDCISGDGKSTGYAEKVFAECNNYQLKNLLFNLGKLDWRLTQVDGNQSKLLDGIWRKLNPISQFSDPHIAAVSAVASYQPERALGFADNLIREKRFLEQLPEIIKNAAYSLDHLKHACESLWEIGKDDKRPLNQYPDHAIRILSELCEFTPYQPLEFNKIVIDFAINLLNTPGTCSHEYTPFDILEGIIRTKGHRAFSTKEGFILEQYDVPPSVVAPLRILVVDAATKQLSGTKVSIAILAAKLLQTALRCPVSGALSGAYRKEWDDHFEQILLKIEEVVQSHNVHAMVLTEILHAVSWHSKYGTEKTAEVAKRIVELQPDTLEFRTTRALIDGYDDFFDEQGSEHVKNKSLGNLVESLLSAYYSKPKQLCLFINDQITNIENFPPKKRHNAQVLVSALVERSIELAKTIVGLAIDQPTAAISQFADCALANIFRNDHALGLTVARKFLDSHSTIIKAAIGAAFWRSGILTQGCSAADLEVLQEVLRSEDLNVVGSALFALRVLIPSQKRLLIDLIKCVNLNLHQTLADPVIELISSEDVVAELVEEDIQCFLGSLMLITELEGYWVQTFLANLSKYYPILTAQFFMNRVEHAVEIDDWSYRACNHDVYEQVPLRFRESSEFHFLLHSISQWMRCRDDYAFRRRSCELFQCMFGPFDAKLLPFLQEWIDRATAEELLLISQILSEVPRDFVLNQRDFIVTFLSRASQFGKDILDEATQSLYRAGTTGIKSGEFGKPFAEDTKTKDSAESALNSLPRFSPAYKLYDWLYKYAENEIHQSFKKAEYKEFV